MKAISHVKACTSNKSRLDGRLSYVIGVINASSLSEEGKQTLTTLAKKKTFIRRLVYDLCLLLEVHKKWTSKQCIKCSKSDIKSHLSVLQYNLLLKDYELFVKCLKARYRW